MKAYKGSFKKKNGETREMVFAHIADLPRTFLETKVLGAGSEQKVSNWYGISLGSRS
jgi:hypothetical protein